MKPARVLAMWAVGAVGVFCGATAVVGTEPPVMTLPDGSRARAGVVVFKVRPDVPAQAMGAGVRFGGSRLDAELGAVKAARVEQLYPRSKPARPDGTDLTRIYTAQYAAATPPDQVAAALRRTGQVEYAEPWFVQEWFLDHNDPLRDRQYNLDLIAANAAHDLSTGSPAVSVAVTDIGMDMEHPDLVDNLWVNPGEDLNGDGEISRNEVNNRDDDGNGKVDDFWGWDFMGNDNDPADEAQTYRGHGTHTAGIASAVTNNETGIASVGYSCRIIQIRVGSDGGVYYGYQGIAYAADVGARVVSNSWGGTARSNQEQDVVNYATEHGCLVVAAAGNSNSRTQYFPGAYDHVVCVAGTDRDDRRWQSDGSGSTYGEWVDISAPAHQVLSTYPGGDYREMTGTSMACPLVAGAAALIMSTFPELNLAEVENLLEVGADDIYNRNPDYQGMLGAGRLNIYRSLMAGPLVGLEVLSLEVTGDEDGNGRLDPGERAELTAAVRALPDRRAAREVVLTLECDDPEVRVAAGRAEHDELAPGQTWNNRDQPFVVEVPAQMRPHSARFTVTAATGTFQASRSWWLVIGQVDVLVVDDDAGGRETRWFQTLDTLGTNWARWDASERGAPDPDTLTDYRMVIWETGDAVQPLDEDDRRCIQEALQSGARVLLAGARLGDDPENRDFLEETFGAQAGEDSVGADYVTGLPGRFLDRRTMVILYANNFFEDARWSASTMTPVGDADSLLMYYYRNEPAGVAGVFRDLPGSAGKAVHLGFCLEVCSDAVTPRRAVLQAVYEWFQSDLAAPPTSAGSAPATFILNPAHPNPFNRTFQVDFAVPAAGEVTWRMVDILGRTAARGDLGTLPAGWHRLAVAGAGLPAGTYVLEVQAGGRLAADRVVMVK